MTEPVLVLEGVSKSFGSDRVLEEVNLTVEKGEIFAFLGRNGAGKTTTILMLLGLLERDGGEIRVLGLDPVKDSLEIRRRVGYMAEDQTMFGWMRVEEILGFLAPFYPTWDRATVNRFASNFELPLKAKIKTLSKGQNARLALLLALAHRPELVILDDPTLGLDPIARKEFMREVIDHLQGSGATVFFSSHLLYEIEPVADKVAILDKGRIVRQAETEELRNTVKRVLLRDSRSVVPREVPGLLDVDRKGDRVAYVVENAEGAIGLLRDRNVPHEVVDLNLDEIFEAYIIGRKEVSHVPEPALEGVA